MLTLFFCQRAADYWGVPDRCSDTGNVFSINLLRTAKLEEILTQGEKHQPAVEGECFSVSTVSV